MNERYRKVDQCRVCGASALEQFLSLGTTPLANAFIRPDALSQPEPRIPLEVVRCLDCGLVQLSVVVSPDLMFARYVYASSASQPLIQHFSELALEISSRYVSGSGLVVEIGSNDGVLLRRLKDRGIRAVGVEPAANLAEVANAAGLDTWHAFFDPSVALRLRDAKGAASVIVGTNVLAHIDDLRGVVHALDVLLDDDGVFVAEVPYLIDLLDNVEYDTIYHEHLSYFALGPLSRLFEDGGLQLFDVQRLRIHGGSIRICVGRPDRHEPTEALRIALAAERAAALSDAETYQRFAVRTERSRELLTSLLARLRAQERRLAALGATAKGNTLLNYCGVSSTEIEFIADSTPWKQGLLAPGTHIPVREEDALLRERPEFTLLLAWNYAESILKRHRTYLDQGGHFIHPIPEARVLS